MTQHKDEKVIHNRKKESVKTPISLPISLHSAPISPISLQSAPISLQYHQYHFIQHLKVPERASISFFAATSRSKKPAFTQVLLPCPAGLTSSPALISLIAKPVPFSRISTAPKICTPRIFQNSNTAVAPRS